MVKECKEIPLSQGKMALVDAEDYKWLNQWKWYAHKDGNTFYAVRWGKKNGKWFLIRMHREIMKCLKDEQIDHINSNGVNNRKDNLRICNKSQNLMNRGRPATNTSGFKGVSWHKKAGKWQAKISADCKIIHLGLFSSKENAAKAYNGAAIKYHGEFARLNK